MLVWTDGEPRNFKIGTIDSLTFNEYDEDTFIISTKEDWVMLDVMKERIRWRNLQWGKIKYKKNALFIGDSVTKSFVVEGTADNPMSVYTDTIDYYRYPYAIGDIIPQMGVTIMAQTGIKASQWIMQYSNEGFAIYDLIVIELGLNGTIHYEEIDKEGSEAYCYKTILETIREQNKNVDIFLVSSPYFSHPNRPEVLKLLANGYNCHIIDLHDASYGDLASIDYHGFYTHSDIDYAHYTRKGYNKKAYVVAKMIDEQLNLSE